MSSTGLLLIVVFGALGAFVQSVTGFGGALVLAPVLFATMSPPQAVLLSALLGLAQSSVLVLRNRHKVLRHELRSLLVFALPGLAVGVLVLRVAATSTLRVAVGVSVIVATILGRALARGTRLPLRAAAPAGFLAGLLTTSVTVNGPPLVLYLGGRGATAAQMRGTLGAAFLALDAVAIVGLAAGGALVAPPASAVVALGVSFVPGMLAGLWLAPRLREEHYANGVTLLLLALGVASVVAGLS